MIKRENVLTVICEKETSILGATARYRLIKIDLSGRDVYAVTVSYRDEHEEVLIGGDEDRARRFLCAVLKNSVTPCTFFDVFADFNAKIQ